MQFKALVGVTDVHKFQHSYDKILDMNCNVQCSVRPWQGLQMSYKFQLSYANRSGLPCLGLIIKLLDSYKSGEL